MLFRSLTLAMYGVGMVVGALLATRVMRKHRLAECLLVSVIQMPWEEVHVEACRWEHVISESVERRLYELLGHPERCPHGNPIPGLAELAAAGALAVNFGGARSAAAGDEPNTIVVKGFMFTPMTMTVKAGTKVTWSKIGRASCRERVCSVV